MIARALLSRCIDYAGLFPPAGLDVETTVANYERYRAGSDAWALGRLILPVETFLRFAESEPERAAAWPLSLLWNANDPAELARAQRSGIPLEAVECKPAGVPQIAACRSLVPPSTVAYFEVPTGTDPEETIAAIAAAGGRAKIRTGGITPDAIPPVSEVVRFLASCVRHRVPFKATAGLHHAIRGRHPLTYQPGSAHATMHGFLNVILATAILRRAPDTAAATALLEDESPENFRIDPDQAHWRNWTFHAEEIRAVRQQAMVSFGSCSFTEPIEEMKSLGWLQ
jgi:hypothetical protein